MKISLNSEKRFSKFICLALIYLFIINMSNGLAQLTGISVSTISIAFKALIGIYFVTLVPGIITRFTKSMAITVGISLIVALLNYAIFPAIQEYFVSTMIDFFVMCLPITLAAMSISDVKYFKNCLLGTAYIMVGLSLILLYGVFSKRFSFYQDSYSMAFGYSMITPILILSFELINGEEKKFVNMLGIVALMSTLLLYGSRGPLVGVLLFVVFYSVRYCIENKKYWMILLIIAFAIILIIAYELFFLELSSILSSLGIRSRTLDMLTNGTLTRTKQLTERDLLWGKLLEEIAESPFQIRGINAEWRVLGIYAHNIVIELLYQFGVILGGAVIACIAAVIIRQLLNREYTLGNELSIILMFSTIPGLMLSNSLWISSSFWIWVGFSAGVWEKQDNDADEIEKNRINSGIEGKTV